MAYFPTVIPYPGTPGAPFFDGRNITHFLDIYSQLCSDYRLSESEKINRLPSYCEFFTGNYVKILIKEADWAAVRAILRREYKENDLDQLMYSREFLEALKKKPRSEDDDLMQYCYMFASISRHLVSRQRLDRYTQCQWFLQGLPEKIVMEIFYRYDIDLEDDGSLDFEDVLEKALVLVKRSKCLADFIRDRENDLIDKHTGLEEKRPNAPNTVEPFTLSAQDLTPPIQFNTVQATVQEDVPIVRIHASRVKEVNADKERLNDNDCVLVLDPNEDFYDDFEALFSEPVDEYKDLVHHRIGPSELLERVKSTRIGTRSLDIKSEKTVQRLELQTPKKDGICIEKRRYLGPGYLVVGRLRQKAVKSEDHG